MVERRGAYRVLVQKPEGKRPIGRPRQINRRLILRWISSKWDVGMDWIDLAQDRGRWLAVVNGGNERSGSIQCGECIE